VTHDGDDATMKIEEGSSDTREYPCLLRATDGKSAKFSTRVKSYLSFSFQSQSSSQRPFQVESKQLFKFHAVYGSLLKTSMTSLRKRDKKRDKQRAEQAAKRKKQMTEPIVLDGSKRGSGRRQRQRKLKALVKQQESQRKFREREEERKKVESKVAA
jgi:signal recognition particle subunit SRP14